MIVLDEANEPVDRIDSFLWMRTKRERMTRFVYLLGKLIAYLPHDRRAYYAWLLILSYRPAQQISARQFSPPHLRVILFSRWELGLILGHWGLGLRLGQPLVWFRRLQPAA
jgi:hypothetical protein